MNITDIVVGMRVIPIRSTHPTGRTIDEVNILTKNKKYLAKLKKDGLI